MKEELWKGSNQESHLLLSLFRKYGFALSKEIHRCSIHHCFIYHYSVLSIHTELQILSRQTGGRVHEDPPEMIDETVMDRTAVNERRTLERKQPRKSFATKPI
jgi:hypothetical protein